VRYFPQKEKENKQKGDSAMTKNLEHERLISAVIDTAFRLHKELGPGLMESLYETVLAGRLGRMGIHVVRQMPVNVVVDGISFADAYRVDLFLENWLVVELKALDRLLGVHVRQAQTYVKLLDQPYGLIINFGSETFSEGVRRVYNNR
jgi:GxxExxY protein